MRVALFSLFALVPAFAHGQTIPSSPFDFKGVALGITLDEMRHAPIRDEHAASARVVCTGDAEVGPISYLNVHLDPNEVSAGVLRCAYYDQSTGSPDLGSRLTRLGMGDGDYISTRYYFDFFPDPNTGEHQLYRMHFVTNIGARTDVFRALQDRFGPPTETRDVPLRNGLGVQFDGVRTIWRNRTGTLMMVTPSGQIDRMSITYELTNLSRRASEAIESARLAAPPAM